MSGRLRCAAFSTAASSPGPRSVLPHCSPGARQRLRCPRDIARRGLRHLYERAETAGGEFYVNSSPSMGTIVAFDLPLET